VTQRAVRRIARGLLAALAALALSLACPNARAASEPERPLPDYDGRAGRGQPTTPGDVLLWVPRVVLFPLYVVTEYVIRRPLGAGITAAERSQLPAAIYDFFTFGPNHSAGIVPVAFVDFGFTPSIGLYTFWDDAGFRGHQLRLHGSTGGSKWLAGTLTERFVASNDVSLTLSGSLIRRPDYTFYGIGPNTREDNLSRYGADTADVRAVLRNRFWRSSTLETSVGYRGVSFYPGDFGGEPTLTDRAQAGAFPVPDGYTTGYQAPFWRTVVTFDTRAPSGGSETGGRLQIRREQGIDLSERAPSGWLRYGATLGGFLDLGDSGRVVSLSVSADLADPVRSRPVPFNELVTLGGPADMPGFRAGRLYGRSSAVATLRYSWPIWIWLDGSLQAAVGNVFDAKLEGASLKNSRFSGAIGIESSSSRDSVFQLLVGFGTETFDSGAELNSIRVVAGARSGF
jgi:hypothetical protein